MSQAFASVDPAANEAAVDGHERFLSDLRRDGRKRQCLYMSTPITTGRRLLDHTQSREAQIEENISHARAVAKRLRTETGMYVIDPTELDDVEGWEQSDYHGFWLSVIREWVSQMVFCDGWEYSTGCCLEFAEATRLGLPVFDEDGTPLSVSASKRLVVDAIRLLGERGHGSDAQEAAVRLLDGKTSQGPEL